MPSVSVKGTSIGGTCGGVTESSITDVTIATTPINVDGDATNHPGGFVKAGTNTTVTVRGNQMIVVTGDSVTPHDSKPTHNGAITDSGVSVTIS
jgi:uncharacterized Zn-binding protein involved in type VI secretion